MKKIFMIAIMAVMSMVAFAKSDVVNEVVKSTNEGIAAVYNDGTDAVSTLYNDGKGIVTSLYGDGKTFVKEAYPEVKEAIVSIASAIGVAAEHVYTVLVKKFLVEGIGEFLILLAGLILIVIGWIKFDKYVVKRKEDPIDWHILYPILILVGGIVCIVNVNYHEMLINLINPEWGAINYILDFTKSMIH